MCLIKPKWGSLKQKVLGDNITTRGPGAPDR